MKIVQAPEVNTHQTPEANAVAPSTHISQGGGGSRPGFSPGPAQAVTASAQMSSAANTFLMVNPPLVTLLAEIARKLSGDSTSFVCPPSYADEADGLEYDRALFVRLYREARLDEAHALCCERAAALSADDKDGRINWACNLSMLRRDAGDYINSLALLNLVSPYLPDASPLYRAKYHNSMGRTRELMGDPVAALEEYGQAFPCYVLAGRPDYAAIPLLNIGRVKNAAGDSGAREYLHLAARVAVKVRDFRLLGEIAEEGSKL